MTAPTHPMELDCHCEWCLLEQQRRMRQILIDIGAELPAFSERVVPITHPMHRGSKRLTRRR